MQVYVYKKPGATLASIVPMIREFNARVHYDAIYVMVGNNNLTSLDRDTYRISIQEENPYDILDMFNNTLTYFKLETAQFMMQHPVIVMPLTPIEMSMYNDDYFRDPKQWILNMAVNMINEEIIFQNSWSRFATPLIHEVIYRAEGQGVHRYYYNRLRDGLHPTSSTTRKWAYKVRRALSLNGHI